MNDQHDFERLVADSVQSIGLVAPSDGAHELTSSRVRQSRQDPEWLALIKESPMRSNSHVAVGSPTVRVMAILAATLLLAVALAAAGAGVQRLLAAGPIVVAQDGSGHYTTINEAIAVAEDGDEILVKPGTYPEVVVIDKDIVLRGDGSREEVILEFGSDGPVLAGSYGRVPYGLMLVDTEATVSDLTVRGPNVAADFVLVGGAPTLERVSSELEGDFSGAGPHTSIAVLHGAGGTIRDSLFDGIAWHAGVQMIPEYEDISGTGLFVVEDNVSESGFGFDITDGSVFRRNTITDGGLWLTLVGSGSVLIAENELVEIGFEDGSSDGVTIRDNTIHGGFALSGIDLGTGTAIVEGNTISGMNTGIAVPDGATPTITGNQLEDLGAGIRIDGGDPAALIEDNRFCGNDQNVVVDGSEAQLDPSNEVCDEPAEG